MHARGKLALAVVTGGIALGALLGAAVNPEPKHVLETRNAALQDPVPADTSYQITDSGAFGPAPGWGTDGYAPSWASEELGDLEPRYPAWTYSEVSEEPGPPPPELQPEAKAPAAEPEASDLFAPEPRGEGGLGALY